MTPYLGTWLTRVSALEEAMEFLNAVHVRPCFFNATGSVCPFSCFLGVESMYVCHADR